MCDRCSRSSAIENRSDVGFQYACSSLIPVSSARNMSGVAASWSSAGCSSIFSAMPDRDTDSVAHTGHADLPLVVGKGPQPDLGALFRHQGREALGPFEQHQRPARKNVVEAETLHLPRVVQPIKIDVINRHS